MAYSLEERQMKYVAVFLAVFLAACSAPTGVETTADVAKFHRALATKDHAAIWRNASEEMRGATSEADLIKLLSAIDRKLGKVVTTKQVGWRTNVTTSGTFAVVQMETRFERGNGVETFTFKQVDSQLQLVGYNINSNEMMLN